MPVEDVFSITGRGTVATGRVERGTLHVSDEVEIIGIHEDVKKTVVTGIEMFRKLLDEAQAGDNIGALLRGIQTVSYTHLDVYKRQEDPVLRIWNLRQLGSEWHSFVPGFDADGRYRGQFPRCNWNHR